VFDPPDSPEDERTIARAHPLARRLVERLRRGRQGRVLDFAAGNGRNGAALRAAGFTVVSIDDARAGSQAPLAGLTGRFAAVVTTHGLLHGSPGAIEARLDAIAEAMHGSGLLYATFGSSRDARFGKGECLGATTFAPHDGDERGVAHTYFDRDGLEALLQRRFSVESLEEHAVDDAAGTWAHEERALAGAVHWFAVVSKLPS